MHVGHIRACTGSLPSVCPATLQAKKWIDKLSKAAPAAGPTENTPNRRLDGGILSSSSRDIVLHVNLLEASLAGGTSPPATSLYKQGPLGKRFFSSQHPR